MRATYELQPRERITGPRKTAAILPTGADTPPWPRGRTTYQVIDLATNS
jgi:hypothetical protein